MDPARKDEHQADDSLPDPRLNPMINPRLGRNLGRWASVYYTTPPEKREQAVLELVRELEGTQTSRPETESVISRRGMEEPAIVQAMPGSPNLSTAVQPNFCGTCGSALKAHRSGDPKQQASSSRLLPARLQVDRQPAGTGAQKERRRSQKHVLLVLVTSAAIGVWGFRQIRLIHVPQLASEVPPVSRATTGRAPAIIGSRNPGTQKVTPAQPLRAPSPDKPPAGHPIACTDHIEKCPGDELYRRCMASAAAIDGLFLDYDKRVKGLLRETTARANDSSRQIQTRTRRANYSAQLWERLQLATYVSHHRHDALAYRAELMRRVLPGRDTKALNWYENPESCLELHYVAEDLRRLAAGLRMSQTTTPPSAMRTPSASPVP